VELVGNFQFVSAIHASAVFEHHVPEHQRSGIRFRPQDALETRVEVVNRHHQSPVDIRPFQARATLERQESLEAQYGKIAIDEVVAALRQINAVGERTRQAPKAA
jgi:hypothetical protein